MHVDLNGGRWARACQGRRVPFSVVGGLGGHVGGNRLGNKIRAGFGLLKKQGAIKTPLQNATPGQPAGPGTAEVGVLRRVVPAWQHSVGAGT